jgi:hypothetical protein
MISRRSFLAAGALGAVALATAGWLHRTSAVNAPAGRLALGADGEAIFRALIPVMLAGAIPGDGAGRRDAVTMTLNGVDLAVAGLPSPARKELSQLFSLLTFAPARLALAQFPAPWTEASDSDVRALLDRLRSSRWQLLRAAYDALHQLVFAAWYGNPHSWPAIGYGGPPQLTA